MALGNLGHGLKHYGHASYDHGHALVFFAQAHANLTAALSPDAQFDSYDAAYVRDQFSEVRADIERHVDVEAVRSGINFDGFDLGAAAEEQEYRRWALEQRLFLNPLNDLGPHRIAARDILSLPDYVTTHGESPTLIGFFNQMKQEYVSARWFLYEAIRSHEPHFSDRDVALYDTLDYPIYGLAMEQARAAYRMAYSLFDKVAFFLNDYADLAIELNRVYFKTIWYEKQDARKRVVRDKFVTLQNWPLRGLFWLSKDFFDDDFQESAEPDAQELYVIRNRLEHRYLKIHEMPVPGLASADLDPFYDRLAYSVQREAFFGKTLLVLRRARAALIYLSLGMHREERRRSKHRRSDLTVPMHLPHLDDDWKR